MYEWRFLRRRLFCPNFQAIFYTIIRLIGTGALAEYKLKISTPIRSFTGSHGKSGGYLDLRKGFKIPLPDPRIMKVNLFIAGTGKNEQDQPHPIKGAEVF